MNNMKEDNVMVRNNIEEIISLFKNDIDNVIKQERYKWDAITWYQNHWDIDANDFGAMIEEALSKANNLLKSANSFPYGMIVKFAKEFPEEARNLFKTLYDEDKPFEERFNAFRERQDQWIIEMKKAGVNPDKSLAHYQDLHAITVYLMFQYPAKYFIYKYTPFNEFVKRIQLELPKSNQKDNVQKFNNFNTLCELILSVVKEDEDLIQMYKEKLGGNYSEDEYLHFLTHDIFYYGGVYLKKEDIDYSKYWPTKEEYDPGLSKEDWIDYLQTIEMPEHPSPMQMLKAMMEMGGEATCSQLAEKYGGTHNRYIGCTFNLGRRVKKYFNLNACMDNGQDCYFVFPFLGRELSEGNGGYSYLIRPELQEALKELDLSSFDLYVTGTDDMDCEENTYVEEKITYGKETDINLNTILYGPPGTGKTYHTLYYAVAIAENKPLSEVINEDYYEILKRYNYHKSEGYIEFITFHQSYGYEEFIEGIKPKVKEKELSYELNDGIFKRFCNKAKDQDKNYVFIIDEINRGNISKIFGELITLIEDTKRLGKKESMKVKLPYTNEIFGVPKNVYILGTMNTADRSIAMIDTALRRRFRFEEMMPDVNVLQKHNVDKIGELDVAEMLRVMNERITYLYDREHTIGHSFFLDLKEDLSVEKLGLIFKNSIVPLLQEYFYDDYERIQMVLGDNDKDKQDNLKFIISENLESKSIFKGDTSNIDLPTKKYRINEEAFKNIESYVQIMK